MLVLSVLAFAQTKSVTGQVLDENGAPVPFATVTQTGTKNATSANADGKFSIKVPEGRQLTITATGFTAKTVTPSGTTALVTLAKSEGSLQEVVVTTAQGIRRQPRELGYSTARLSNSDITQAHVTNAATGLAAKVSGLQVNLTNNGVNPSTRVTLRGNRSILGNNQALLVLDDVPVDISYINSINPNDIENMTVLKGASASALYGSAASNGVIMITTKKGTRGRPIIRYSNTVQIEEVAYLPKLQNEFGAFGGEPIGAPGTILFPENPVVPYVSYENQFYGPRFNGRPIFIGAPVRIYRPDGTYFDSLQQGIYSAKPDAKKNFFDKGITEQNDFSVSGGDDKSRFFFSVQDVNVRGTVPGDKNRRDAIRLNGQRDIGQFTVNYSVDYTLTHTNTTPGSFTVNGSPTTFGGSYFQNRAVYWTVINTPPNIDLRQYRDWRNDPFANPNGYYNAYYGNPWWQIDASRLDQRRNDLLGVVSLNFKPTNWINLMGRAAITRQDFSNKYTSEGLAFASWAKADAFGSGRNTADINPTATDATSYSNKITGDFIAQANHKLGPIDAELVIGGNLQDTRNRTFQMASSSLLAPGIYNVSVNASPATTYENLTQIRLLGAYGDLTLKYHNFLSLHGSLRNDWTSLLSMQNRSFLYPAVDAAFVFTDVVPGLKQSRILTYGKLRGAWSKVGQVSIGAYSLNNVLNTGSGFPYSTATAGFTVDNTYANADIKPEFVTEKEIGLELGFLPNSRITLEAAYYNTRSTNQTIPITISPTTGFSNATINSGVMTNRGVELDLKFTPLLNLRNGFRWNIGANFTYIDNKVESLAPGLNNVLLATGSNSYAVIGKPYPSIQVNDWARDDQGRIIVNANSGFPSPGTLGPQYIGGANPPYKVGLNTQVSWKGLTLSVVADGRFGAVIDNNIGGNLDFTGVSAYSTSSGRQPFVIPNSSYLSGGKYVPNTNIVTKDGNALFWASTWNAVESNYVTSADFWKLRELALSYEFPRSLIQNAKFVKGINLGFVARNLFTWKAKDNVWTDPEFSFDNSNATGFTNINQTPPSKFYGANLTITF